MMNQLQRSTAYPMYNGQQFRAPQLLSVPSKLVAHHCQLINEKGKNISSSELANTLDELLREINQLHKLQKKANLYEIISVLIHASPSALELVGHHKFFRLLQTPFIQLIYQWNRTSYLNENEVFMFRNIVRLIKIISRNTVNNLCPSWLLSSATLKCLSNCITHLAESERFLDDKNRREFKNFVRVIDIYIRFQERSNTDNSSKYDILMDSFLRCLTSNQYMQILSQLAKTDKKSLKLNERFFLLRCPAFVTLYHGTRLEQLMEKFLSTMLPRYTKLFDDIISSINQWSHLTIRAIYYLLNLVHHGPTSSKILAKNLPFINHVLTIVDAPTVFKKIDDEVSTPEASLVFEAISLFSNTVSEPDILSHIKQKKATPTFLRLKSVQDKTLAQNVHTILAKTTTEDDIKSMSDPSVLLTTVNQSLKNILEQKPDDTQQIEQLLETLKGLIQHDQMKEEILKQDFLSFLLDSTNKLTGKTLTLLLEILWTLSFSKDAATQIRSNTQFIEKVQEMSKDADDEGMKRAADGLVWKLVKEKVPKFDDLEEETEEVSEVVVGPDGEKTVLTRRVSIAPSERVFQYDMMISYCHADQPLIRKIHEFLTEQGFKIWIDLNHMFGPAMSAMAEAVENSEFVLICMSDSYKQSTYCQAEAEYAFGCKRRLIPLIVKPGYKADGWLGFMIGSRIYVDFGRFEFPVACEKLMNEISLQRKRPLPSKTAPAANHIEPEKIATTTEVPPPPPPPSAPAPIPARTPEPEKVKKVKVIEKEEKSSKPLGTLPDIFTQRRISYSFQTKPIDQWTESDVLNFLYHHNLNEIMPLCQRMDGAALIQLYKMSASHSNRTFTSLGTELRTTLDVILPIGVYTRFLSLMDRLVPPPPPPAPAPIPAPQPPQVIMLQPPPQMPPLQPPPQIPTLTPPQIPVFQPPPEIPVFQPPSQQISVLPSPPPEPITMIPRMPTPPPTNLRKIVQDPLIQVPIEGSYAPFDVIITSNASTSRMLEIVERLIPDIQRQDAARWAQQRWM